MLENLRESDVDGCLEGDFYFSLFDTTTDIFIDMDEFNEEYVNKCIENLNSLSDEIIDKLCEYSIKYCEDFREYFEDEEIDIPKGIKGREILKYIEPVIVGIEEPDDENSIGYSIELNVAWEEEHGMEWVIKDNQILYTGAFENMGAWQDDYKHCCNYVIYNSINDEGLTYDRTS